MNIYLDQLFEKYDFSEKDRYEVRQIYALLPLHKQRNLISNFEILALNLKKIEHDINIEREILLGHIFKNITNAIEKIRKDKVTSNTGFEINTLKGNI